MSHRLSVISNHLGCSTASPRFCHLSSLKRCAASGRGPRSRCQSTCLSSLSSELLQEAELAKWRLLSRDTQLGLWTGERSRAAPQSKDCSASCSVFLAMTVGGGSSDLLRPLDSPRPPTISRGPAVREGHSSPSLRIRSASAEPRIESASCLQFASCLVHCDTSLSKSSSAACLSCKVGNLVLSELRPTPTSASTKLETRTALLFMISSVVPSLPGNSLRSISMTESTVRKSCRVRQQLSFVIIRLAVIFLFRLLPKRL